MKWDKLALRGLIVLGVLYAIALIPPAIRPSWNAAPFRKADATINVESATSAGSMPSDVKPRLKDACRAAWPFRPLMGSAHHVRVVLIWKEKVVGVRELDCEPYV